MKKRVIAIMISIIFLYSSILAVNAQVKIKQDNIKKSEYWGEVIPIRVAIYTNEEETSEDYYNPSGRTRYFLYALSDYSWKAGDNHYVFVPKIVTTDDIINGELTKENYDVFLHTPCQGDEYLFTHGFKNLPQNILRVQKIKNFVKSGGGYFGTCAGAQAAANMKNQPKTFFELMMKRSSFGISAVEYEYCMAMPYFCQFTKAGFERIGQMGYIQYSGWNISNLHYNYHSGVCVNSVINHNNPIFDDLHEDTRLVRWISGPSLDFPADPDREIKVLASYPDEEISDNESVQIHHWKYTGGLAGLIKAAFKGDGEIQYWERYGIFMRAFVFAKDWEMTDKMVTTNLSGKNMMTYEIYPNDNKARIILNGGHPEMNVWWGGEIQEKVDDENNTIYDAFHHWVNVTSEEETIEDEFSYNYWMIRRCVAWVSQRVPVNELPVVYGKSEVCDFVNSTVNESNFVINGNVEKGQGTVSVDLYYRYSSDNSTWTNWTFFGNHIVNYEENSWEFTSPNGSGYYQFYSIRKVNNEAGTEVEKAPPCYDAEIRVMS